MDFGKGDYPDKYKKALKKMDILMDFDVPIEVNILEVIAKAEAIKEDKRKVKLEILGFISLCLSILLTVTVVAINLNPRLILVIEIIIYILMPFILIPISKHLKAKEGLQ
ncbi:hypothetical protein [Candidatus Clostridium stratigraminis]|uniref:Uncharacterized protein n=1 Tax=Candidatus Clostridium stratigraminis TaxID=3381661 RepID=A0ABW8T579_9CLOT